MTPKEQLAAWDRAVQVWKTIRGAIDAWDFHALPALLKVYETEWSKTGEHFVTDPTRVAGGL